MCNETCLLDRMCQGIKMWMQPDNIGWLCILKSCQKFHSIHTEKLLSLKGCKIKAFPQQSWPLSRRESLSCHAWYGWGHVFFLFLILYRNRGVLTGIPRGLERLKYSRSTQRILYYLILCSHLVLRGWGNQNRKLKAIFPLLLVISMCQNHATIRSRRCWSQTATGSHHQPGLVLPPPHRGGERQGPQGGIQLWSSRYMYWYPKCAVIFIKISLIDLMYERQFKLAEKVSPNSSKASSRVKGFWFARST